MDQLIPEALYPLYFREDVTKPLADHIAHRRSVELVGMKRVGINNFLRFFLSNKHVHSKYFQEKQKHLFVLVDLDNLIEREILPFWRLTFKRIVDAVEKCSIIKDTTKQKISQLFMNSIQSGDLFLTFDGVREVLTVLSQEVSPTLFFTRFDRLQDTVTPEFFNNLESLKESTNQKLAYVFTSFRELDTIAPAVFHKKSFYGFSHVLYMKPASYQDIDVMLLTFLEQFSMKLTKEFIEVIIDLTGGHAQYLQLLLIILNELKENNKNITTDEFIRKVLSDERIMLLSEELWENLRPIEQEVIQNIAQGGSSTPSQKEKGAYIWHTGMVKTKGKENTIFTPLFSEFLRKESQTKENADIELSKKEYMLFSLLKENLDTVCEREKIVEVVWPEYKEYGVSDWSIDRLVARVRNKLKQQENPYEIITVRTRGYKLVSL